MKIIISNHNIKPKTELKLKMPLHNVVENFIASHLLKREQFVNGTDNVDLATLQATYGTAAMWTFVIMTVAVYLVLMLIGKWLWNSTAVNMISVLRPVESVFQLVGLSILVKLVLY